MAAQLPYDERLLELLSLRAIEGLDDAEQEEVQRLGSAYPEFDAEELDRAAAALVLATGCSSAGDDAAAAPRSDAATPPTTAATTTSTTDRCTARSPRSSP